MLDSIKAHVDALYDELGLNAEWHEGKLCTHRDQASPLTELVLLQKDVSLLKEETSLFTLAERVGELEESRSRHRKRLDILEAESKGTNICLRVLGDRLSLVESDDLWNKVAALSDEVRRLKALQEDIHPALSETWTVPRIGEPPRIGELEKPKSAWKPLRESLSINWPFLVRNPHHDPGVIRSAFWIGRDVERPKLVLLGEGEEGIGLNIIENWQFCPIPE